MSAAEATTLQAATDTAGRLDGLVRLAPITQKAARKWVKETHRHLDDYPAGDLWRIALLWNEEMCALGVAGRPCKELQDGTTAEFTRLSSVAPPDINACSRLYGALRRAGLALGYTRFVTYTLEHEPGTSLRAAGFYFDGLTDGGEWSRPSRTRRAAKQSGPKRRWIWPHRSTGRWDDLQPNAVFNRRGARTQNTAPTSYRVRLKTQLGGFVWLSSLEK